MFKYILDSSAESNVIGVNDGSYQIVLSEKNNSDPNLKSFLFNNNKPWPDLKFNNLLNYKSEIVFEKRKKAILTDFIQHSPYIYCVGVFSEKFVDLLKGFKLHENIVFKEITIHDSNNKVQEKFFIVQQPNFNDFIDWENTLFYKPLQREIFKNEICFKFKNESHYNDTISLMNISKIGFQKAEINEYDFISTLSYHFFSDRLTKAIIEANLTNIILKDIHLINCSDILPHE